MLIPNSFGSYSLKRGFFLSSVKEKPKQSPYQASVSVWVLEKTKFWETIQSLKVRYSKHVLY